MTIGRWVVSAGLGLILGGCGADTGAEALGTASGELLGAPVDLHNTWSFGVCSGPLNDDPQKGPVGTCLTPGTRCTGTLIARDLVLTARHCLHKVDYSKATSFCTGTFTKDPVQDAPVRVTPSISTIKGSPVWYEVATVMTSNASSLSCAGDLAVLKLKQPVPFSVAKPVRLDLRDLTKHAPDEVAIVGRGVVDSTYDINTYALLDVKDGDLMRRVLQHIPFICVSDTEGDCVAPDIGGDFVVDPGYAQLGGSTASGDSGAGVGRQVGFPHAPAIIGVHSAGTVDPVTGKPNFGFSVRLDIHRSFLRGALFSSRAKGHEKPLE